MNKKIKVLSVFLLTIFVIVLAYCQIYPLYIINPSKNFEPISMADAKEMPDNNMTLSFLYNISKEKHPMGSEANYRVRDYIISCLSEMNVQYNVQTIDLDTDFFDKVETRTKTQLENKKNKYYEFLKNKAGNKSVDEFINNELGYDSFDSFYLNEILKREKY